MLESLWGILSYASPIAFAVLVIYLVGYRIALRKRAERQRARAMEAERQEQKEPAGQTESYPASTSTIVLGKIADYVANTATTADLGTGKNQPTK